MKPEWQPIETAPKDGTKILLTGPHDANGRYMEVCGYWKDRFPVTWMDGHGEPTHWMPLPAPPEKPHDE
ncbi:DUF551 domain-containing protein [Parvibaculum sp.]|uniref:DUF551 domain-containing protein n=1 Tax=Parvibaculum sp. TaxID=2024848 RepID=UPI003C710F5C